MLYRVKDVANFFSVTTVTIYRWIAKGIIKTTKVGGCVFITEEHLMELIREKEEVNKEAETNQTQIHKEERCKEVS